MVFVFLYANTIEKGSHTHTHTHTHTLREREREGEGEGERETFSFSSQHIPSLSVEFPRADTGRCNQINALCLKRESIYVLYLIEIIEVAENSLHST